MKTRQALSARAKALQPFYDKKMLEEKPDSKEPLQSDDLVLSLVESLVKTDLYDLFMTEGLKD